MSAREPEKAIATAAGAADGLRPRLLAVWRRLREGGALMVGVPDYERYVAHMRAVHPEITPLSREAFVVDRMQARYGGKGTGKCPC